MNRSLMLTVVFPVVLVACGEVNGPNDLTDAVTGTGWGDNVSITLKDDRFIYSSNGYPNHALNAEYVMPDDGTTCVPHPTAECTHIEPVETAVSYRTITVEIPTRPEKVEDTTSLPFGAMGVMISGVEVYNPYEGDGVTVAMNGNFTLTNQDGVEVPFMDACNGHPSPHPAEAYHYHGRPECVTSQVDEEGGPSHIIGFAFDGFPIYGDRDIDGALIDPTTLDECNGIESPTPEFPEGVYHYVLLEVMTEQSTIRCLHGKLLQPIETYQSI